MPPRIPQPSHRHGAPFGPWPFLDLDSEVRPNAIDLELLANPLEPTAEQQHWSMYPQSLYPNWTPSQQQKSGITKIVERDRERCTIHRVYVRETGKFTLEKDDVVEPDNPNDYWDKLHEEGPPDVRVRALFVDSLSGPVLQMLGTKFEVEPFFFSSSFNWIPARYQEAVGQGDHITLTLTFIRCMQNPTTMPSSPTSSYSPTLPTLNSAEQFIDTHAPLRLSSTNQILLPDILAIHMVRSPGLSTIISYHPPRTHRTTTAHTLRTRLLAAGQSVYWKHIFSSTISSNPTFEGRVITTTDMTLTQQLHVVHAHLLHYASLLEDFRRSVVFCAQTPNPMLEHASDTETIDSVKDRMRSESQNLLDEIERLEQNRKMQEKRLMNVMDLAFSIVNLDDSKTMQKLTETAVRDSAAMKQISYLTMVFLPANFAAIFGMNIDILADNTYGTLAHYFAFALPMTAVTMWVIMAFQQRKKDPSHLIQDENHVSFWSKLSWPLNLHRRIRWIETMKRSKSRRTAEQARLGCHEASEISYLFYITGEFIIIVPRDLRCSRVVLPRLATRARQVDFKLPIWTELSRDIVSRFQFQSFPNVFRYCQPARLRYPRSWCCASAVNLIAHASVNRAPISTHPSHRHGAPFGPWPFLDLDSEVRPNAIDLELLANPLEPTAEQQHWSMYPQSLYPNWTPSQQQKSGITKIVERDRERCTIHRVYVRETGKFTREKDDVVEPDNPNDYWDKLHEEVPPDVRVRALFVDSLSGPVLQILGTKFDIEPFFFSSSFNWIPARYQEAVGQGDHITLTLTFIRCMQNPTTMPSSPTSSYSPTLPTLNSAEQVIDTHAPLRLSSTNQILLPDILAIHMVRSPGLSTIISYHPPRTHRTTTAHTLRTRLLAAGQSVYWKHIFSSTISSNPTFVLLALLWYPLYAFDEALDALYSHICWLEGRVITMTDMTLTQQLHVVRAHLLHYASLLEDFRRSVVFCAQTPNPMLEHASDTETIASVKARMRSESQNLLDEIERLEQNRKMQEKRLKNVMDLAFSSVNLDDSKTMQKLTEAAVRDSAAMKQISYLTMVFLPASFAAIFGMNIDILADNTYGTLAHYFAFALPMTAVTMWVIMAFQQRKKDPSHLIQDENH
ncbi:hypothetical protein C8R45DRAFT_794377, partial [Mycena sanguinolenta]